MILRIYEALKSKGIEVEHCNGGAIKGTTPKGKHFYIDKACGTFNQVSVSVEDMNFTAHCLPKTAIIKISMN